MTSEYQTHNDATQVLIQNMVQNIESELLNYIPEAALKIRLGHDSSVLHSGWQGIVVTDKNGHVLAQNAIASSVLSDQLKPGDPIEAVIDSLALDRIRKTDQFYYQVESVRPIQGTPSSHPRIASSDCPLHHGEQAIEIAWQQAKRVMEKRIGLVISGETGTGKNEFIKALHQNSDLASKPLVAINCGALPKDLIESELFGYAPGAFTGAHPKGFEGRFRQADGGILFLDEIADLPLNAQSRLLHVLQEKIVAPIGANRSFPVDVYVIVASHKNLPQMVARGEFREDLWYRLEGLSITLPSVRDREDIKPLIESLFATESSQQRLSNNVIDLMLQYNWPGNLREVHSTCRLIAALCDTPVVNISDLPENIFFKLSSTHTTPACDGSDLQSTIDSKLLKTIEEVNGNVSLASRMLGISRNTIYRKLRKLGINK